MREAAKLKKVLEEALQQPTPTSSGSSGTAAAAASTDTPVTAAADGGKDGPQGQGDSAGTAHRAGTESLVTLAERLLRRADGAYRELENVREALMTTR